MPRLPVGPCGHSRDIETEGRGGGHDGGGGRSGAGPRSAPPCAGRGSAHRSSASASSCSTGPWARCCRATAWQRPTIRGQRFAHHPRDLRGANDLLTLTRPDIVLEIHARYLAAGADIITTNTFNATRIAMADYGLEPYVEEMDREAARLARQAADAAEAADPEGRPRWVLGSLGPTNRTASLSPDVNDRGCPQHRLRGAGGGLPGGRTGPRGRAARTCWSSRRSSTPSTPRPPSSRWSRSGTSWASACRSSSAAPSPTASGRTLSGQTVAAFWNSIRHARPLAVGLNCALGGRQLRPYAQELAGLADTFLSLYPNAGLPNAFGEYDETPADTAGVLGGLAADGVLNIVGGCCGTGPEHVAAIAAAVRGRAPRVPPVVEPRTRLAGLEPLDIGPESLFVNVGERTNVTGSRRFARLVRDGEYATAVEVARQQVESGAQVLDINMDEALLDSEAAMTRFVRLLAAEPDISRVPFMIDSSKWSVIEAGLRAAQGRPIVNSVSLKEGEAEFLRQARLARRYGAAVVVMAFDEQGQAETVERRLAIAHRAVRLLTSAGRLRGRGHHPRPQHLRHRHGHRGARRLRRRLHRDRATYQGRSCRASSRAAASPTSPSRSAATTPCARPSTPSSCSTPSRPGWTWPSSTPAPCRSSTTSTRSCASASRTSSWTAVPTPPSVSSRSRMRPAARPAGRPATSPGARRPSTSASRTPSWRASPTGSWRTPRRLAWRRPDPWTSSRGRSWPAWTSSATASAAAACSCPRSSSRHAS